MGMMMRYALRVFVSGKHMTANVVEGNRERVVAGASTVEHALRGAFEWGKGCDARAAACVGEVLAMRLKTEAPELGGGGGVHFDAEREIQKKTVDNGDKVSWFSSPVIATIQVRLDPKNKIEVSLVNFSCIFCVLFFFFLLIRHL